MKNIKAVTNEQYRDHDKQIVNEKDHQNVTKPRLNSKYSSAPAGCDVLHEGVVL